MYNYQTDISEYINDESLAEEHFVEVDGRPTPNLSIQENANATGGAYLGLSLYNTRFTIRKIANDEDSNFTDVTIHISPGSYYRRVGTEYERGLTLVARVSNGTGYMLYLRELVDYGTNPDEYTHRINLYRFTSSNISSLGGMWIDFSPRYCRLQCDGSTIRANVWSDSVPEGDWKLTGTNSLYDSGTVGFGSSWSNLRVDTINVESDGIIDPLYGQTDPEPATGNGVISNATVTPKEAHTPFILANGQRTAGVSDPLVAFSDPAGISQPDYSTDGLIGHWDAMSLNLSGGDQVTSWEDSSGSGMTLTSGGSSHPTIEEDAYNGHSVVRFGGSARLETTNVTNHTEVTVVGLFSQDNAASDARVLVVHDSGEGWPLWSVQNDGNRNTRWFLTTGSAPFSIEGSREIQNGEYHTVSARFSSGTTLFDIHVDGDLDASASSSGNFARNADELHIGYYPTASTYWVGGVAEFLVYDRPLSDSEREEVEAYLESKWAETAEPEPVEATGDAVMSLGTGIPLASESTTEGVGVGSLSGAVSSPSVSSGTIAQSIVSEAVVASTEAFVIESGVISHTDTQSDVVGCVASSIGAGVVSEAVSNTVVTNSASFSGVATAVTDNSVFGFAELSSAIGRSISGSVSSVSSATGSVIDATTDTHGFAFTVAESGSSIAPVSSISINSVVFSESGSVGVVGSIASDPIKSVVSSSALSVGSVPAVSAVYSVAESSIKIGAIGSVPVGLALPAIGAVEGSTFRVAMANGATGSLSGLVGAVETTTSVFGMVTPAFSPVSSADSHTVSNSVGSVGSGSVASIESVVESIAESVGVLAVGSSTIPIVEPYSIAVVSSDPVGVNTNVVDSEALRAILSVGSRSVAIGVPSEGSDVSMSVVFADLVSAISHPVRATKTITARRVRVGDPSNALELTQGNITGVDLPTDSKNQISVYDRKSNNE